MLKFWRERNWQEVDADVYAEAYQRFGGSVATHPDVITALSELTGVSTRYLAVYENDEVFGCIPVWGKYLAGSKAALKKAGKGKMVDMGNAEVILPLSPDWEEEIPFSSDFISDLHSSQITNLKASKSESISLARSYQSGENGFSKKFKYNRRRELRLLEEAGGEVVDLAELSTEDFAHHYLRLFRLRWGFDIKGGEHLATYLSKIKERMHGSFIRMNNEVIAIQLVLLAESPKWISVEYINGGVDTEYNSFSPGSVLSYVNTSSIEALADSKNKSLRFSFGKSDQEYKDRWCRRSPVFCT